MTNKLKHEEFLKEFAQGSIDLNRMLVQDNPLKVFDVFGTHYTATTHEGLKFNLEKLTKKDLSEWTYEEPYWISGSVKEVIVEDVVPEITIDEVVEDLHVDTAPESEVDWDWVSTLKNKKYDKQELDSYASDKFDIKLNQRNTLDNMIADFKSQLGLSA
ncbi:conserved hypothetical protein [Vibrio phage 249E41-1]|nr:conserved hypothetical protein [Vibrio phage 249E41-1]CAH9015772.1 conserved hypothetical protein [Vibrio phage 193E37-1]